MTRYIYFFYFSQLRQSFVYFFVHFFTKCLLISQIPFPFPLKKKIKEDDHSILFGKTTSKKILLALANFLPLANIVMFNGNTVKFQKLKNTFQIIVLRRQQQLLEST